MNATPSPPVTRPAIQLGIRGAHLGHQNTAVIQTCVPTVSLKGDSYRLRDKDLGAPNRPKSADFA